MRSATFAPLYLPSLIRGFNAAYPGIEIRVRDGDQEELLKGLDKGYKRFSLPAQHTSSCRFVELENDTRYSFRKLRKIYN